MVLTNHGLNVGLPDAITLPLMLQTLLHLDMSHNTIDHIYTAHLYFVYIIMAIVLILLS